jgi:hypothetical protein
MLVIDAERSDVFRGKGDFLIASDFNDAAFAGDDLIEGSAVPKLYGDYLIADAGFSNFFQGVDEPSRNWN